jgi:hypothetical protein
VSQSVELYDLSAGPGNRAATLLIGADEVVLGGHDRQTWPCGGSLEIAA